SFQYAVSVGQNHTLRYETRQTTILFPSRLNGYYRVEKKGSYGPQFSEAYSEASHINNFIPRKEKDPGVDNTAKTRRPQPRSNTKNNRVSSASKSSCSKNKEVEVEEHPRNLLLSKNKKHMSSECNYVKLAIQNDKSEVVCAMGKQCLITANHDVCVLNYVNDMNSRGKKQKANVSKTENQKK
ncbi:hypothetical protein Tco_0414528, partial [Tanacetum coccineum]